MGKTSIAAALALSAAQRGQTVLVCEFDAKGDLADAFEVAELDFAGTVVVPGVRAMVMNTEASLREYLKVQARIPLVGRIGPLSRAFDFVANAAPGVREVLTIGKLAYEVKEQHYDLVIADATASGHVVGQLAAPAAIRDLVKVGLIREQLDWMLRILEDPGQTAAVVVATPEEMPVVETVELIERMSAEAHVALGAVVVNKVLPAPYSKSDAQIFDELAAFPDELAELFGAGAPAAIRATQFAIGRREAEAVHLRRLRDEVDADTPVLLAPHLFGRTQGRRAVKLLAEALTSEAGW